MPLPRDSQRKGGEGTGRTQHGLCRLQRQAGQSQLCCMHKAHVILAWWPWINQQRQQKTCKCGWMRVCVCTRLLQDKEREDMRAKIAAQRKEYEARQVKGGGGVEAGGGGEGMVDQKGLPGGVGVLG